MGKGKRQSWRPPQQTQRRSNAESRSFGLLLRTLYWQNVRCWNDNLKESIMSYFPGMQKGNLDSVKSDAHGKIKKETVALQGVSVTRVTFEVGAKWSNDLKDYAGTQSCQLPHVALVLSGTLRVVMDDGSQQDFSKNDVMLLPPGHDAWSVGNEPCVFVEFSRGNDYYTGEHGH
jgi:mannose-6-phosphate isomerase-like protein (cupin superfamily)